MSSREASIIDTNKSENTMMKDDENGEEQHQARTAVPSSSLPSPTKNTQQMWNYHIVLNRTMLPCIYEAGEDPVETTSDIMTLAVYDGDFPEPEQYYGNTEHKKLTFGWMLQLYKFQAGVYDSMPVDDDKAKSKVKEMKDTDDMSMNGEEKKGGDDSSSSGEEDEEGSDDSSSDDEEYEQFLPTPLIRELWRKYRDTHPVFTNDPDISIDEVQRWLDGSSLLLEDTEYHLLKIIEFENRPDSAFWMFQAAMKILGKAQYRGVMKRCGKIDFNHYIHERRKEDEWVKDVKESKPETITVHVPLPEDMVNDQTMSKIVEEIQSTFPNAKVVTNRDLSEAASRKNWEYRMAYFHGFLDCHLSFRRNLRDGKSESEGCSSGNLNFGIDGYFYRGELMKNIPELSGPNNYPPRPNQLLYEDAYIAAADLLAIRPWSVFAPFEILKVTIKKPASDEDDIVRWVMFSGNGNVDGDEKHLGPFGGIEIQESLGALKEQFGRSAMFLKAGMGGPHRYPDRLFVEANSLGNVHFDTILFLQMLFGPSMKHGSPYSLYSNADDRADPQLPYEVLPTMEVQTGPPTDGHCYLTQDSEGRTAGKRPLSLEEFKIVSLVCHACKQFAKEQKKLKVKPGQGVFERTYRLGALQKPKFVTVSYNMDEEDGGLWNTGQKWRWFP